MYDYMKALHDRFYRPSEQVNKLKEVTRNTHKELSGQLDRPSRILLLQLVDLEDALRNQACLESFVSGYRLAHGIGQELLADQPPYNFEDEDERLACERIQAEKQEVN